MCEVLGILGDIKHVLYTLCPAEKVSGPAEEVFGPA